MAEAVDAQNGVDNKPFWKTKTLDDMSAAEWESLCDGCARCCLVKIEDEETESVHLTSLACDLLNIGSCRCKDYENRFSLMSDCLEINPERVRTLSWLPSTCGYRIVYEGRDLPWWHPLISGTPETVHQAGISVRSFARSECKARGSWERYIIEDFDD